MLMNVEALVLFITCSSVLLLALRKWLAKDKSRFPPGPFAWPVIGHLPLLAHDHPHQILSAVSARYGPIIGLRLGHQRGVVVSSPAMAREVLLTHDKFLANRPPYEFCSTLLYGGHNDIIVNSYGPQWRKLRKLCTLELFTIKRLRELEYVRSEEICALLQRIRDESSGGLHAVNIGICVGHLSTNIVMRLLCSDACEQSKGGENLQMLVRDMEHEAAPTVGDFFPWLKWADFVSRRRMRHVHARIDKFLTTVLRERQSAMAQIQSASAGAYDDLVHALLSKLHVKDDNSEGGITMVEIKAVMLDMIAAGIHTTSTTLEWAMAELLKKPDCLDRLQKEICSVFINDNKPKQYVTESDIANLSYLKCVVKEVFRLHPAVPLLLPRIASEECKVLDYTIPKNTQVFVNVWAIGRDEQEWHKADQFMPERFEDKDIDTKGQYFELLPFGSGRRICAGLPLGLSVVEVALANLVYHFNWELPPGASIDMSEKRGITLTKATPVIGLPKPRI